MKIVASYTVAEEIDSENLCDDKLQCLENCEVSEFTVIDATPEQRTLWEVADPTKYQIGSFMWWISNHTFIEYAAAWWLVNHGNADTSAIDWLEFDVGDVVIVKSGLVEAATDFANEYYLSEYDDFVRTYFDYGKFAADQLRSGTFAEFDFCGVDFVVTNASDIGSW